MVLRLAFMGTPDFAVPTLAELLAQGHDIAAVYSQPPRPKGRGMTLEPSPVHQFAQKAGSNFAVARKVLFRGPIFHKLHSSEESLAAPDVSRVWMIPKGLF